MRSERVDISVPLPTTNVDKDNITNNETAPMPTTPPQNPNIALRILTIEDMRTPEVQEVIKQKTREKLSDERLITLTDSSGIDEKIKVAIAPLVEQKIKYTIDIPDIVVIQTNQQIKVYEDFDIDTSYGFNFNAPTEEIIIESLKTSEITTLKDDNQPILPDTPLNMIISEILNFAPGINYRLYGVLFAKLAEQALEYISKGKTEQETEKTIHHYKKDIARHIWEQLDSHSSLTPPEYEIKLLRPATPILQQDYIKFKEDDILKFTANIPAYEIRKKVVGHFTKACHTAYKFDSIPEHTFSIVLERSGNVLKWLRPAREQFKIEYADGRYQPDFLVETEDSIYIVEIKASNRTDDTEVKLKAKAAQEYCNNVIGTNFNLH